EVDRDLIDAHLAVFDSVKHDVIHRLAETVDGNTSALRREVRPRIGRECAGRKQGNSKNVALEGQLDHATGFDDRSDTGAIGGHELSFSHDIDLFADFTNLHQQVRSQALIDI